MAEFYVDLGDPWKSYSPGETVKGCVVLTISKPLAITHLVICLHGHARVYKNQVVPGDGSATSGFLGAGRGSRGIEYHGNGFASLFEDEVVLCGEGFLKKGVYRFNFELGFPPRGLPSSIEVWTPRDPSECRLIGPHQFERGSVSYLITATLTKPTTIAPTLSCHQRVLFQDSIDVGNIALPKPRIISLEPISHRGRVKAKVRQTSLDEVQEVESSSSKATDREHNLPSDPTVEDDPPLSPVPSNKSSTSAVTTSSSSFQVVHHSPQTAGTSGRNSGSRSTSTSASARAITVSTELLKPGALPGDVVPLKISITHTKPNVRGLIILTLFRQGRIDMHPLIPLTSRNKGKAPEYEDVYPRSRTGLGGLHFSNSSPNSVFRKDLCQTSAMMVINPYTLTADVRASIRIPEDAFPTMANVPGAMIEFKYHVEVVIDLCGKLGESRLLPRISLTSPPQTFTSGNGQDSTGLQVTSNWAGNILDTAQLRRDRSIVACQFEVTVGSKDSTRTSRKVPDGTPSGSQRSYHTPETDPPSIEEDAYGESGYVDDQFHDDGWPAEGWQGHQNLAAVPRFVPPLEPEEEVDEKTRLRRQEELLLPSQCPDDRSTSAVPASAPFIPEEAGLYDNPLTHHDGAWLYPDRSTTSATSARSVDTIVPSYPHAHGQTVNGHGAHVPHADDKEELERQRLMAQASGPPADGDRDEVVGESSTRSNVASAPALTEEDEYNANTFNHGQDLGDNLPRYRQ